MIESFRQTVFVWLSETLTGDVYISVPNQFANQSSVEIDTELVDILSDYPQSEKTDFLFTTMILSGQNPVQVNVITNDQIENERIFLERKPETLWPLMLEGGIMISEPLKNRLNLQVGDSLDFVSDQGLLSFPIIAVFNDYASNQGHALMAKSVYEKNWGIMGVIAISYHLDPTVSPQSAVNELNLMVKDYDQKLLIRDNQTLRADVIQVFDQTFAVTNALRLIATIVSIIGILSAVVLIMIDRKKDIGLLKALGIRKSDLRKLVFTQTSVMGLFAGLFAVPTGIVISLILIYVINLRSFGWTIQLNIQWWYLVQGILISVIAASLGGIYPVFKLERSTALEVLRYE
jgi:putative ABC transport system permease protein